ncbi:MAG TPA: glycosyltransferase family 2 protein [Candidatus Binatia bacterium]
MRQKLPATPTISVIVATRNRRAALARFLDGVLRLPAEPDWELIVVDNGSRDGTAALLASAADHLPLVTIEEHRRGKSRALNKALSHARGELLLFADDDIDPDPLWLTALARAALDYSDANVFGGRILVDQQAVPRWIVDSHNLKTILTTEQDLGDDIQWFAAGEYPVGPSIAVRRRAIESSGCEWPVNLGPGTNIPLGDERAFLMQLSSPQARDRLYVADSIVRHNVTGRELRIASAAARCFLGGYAAGLIDKQRGDKVNLHELPIAALTWRRFRQSGSAAELFCNCARAVGVAAGSVSPYPRIVNG